MKFELQRTKYIPKELKPGVLYVSEEFGFAAHLCACGCGSKIRTPLDPTEWEFADTEGGPTLFPSIGNWQLKCQSHYWITRGRVRWDRKWNEDEILEGRDRERNRREAYYDALYRDAGTCWLDRLWRRVKGLFGG